MKLTFLGTRGNIEARSRLHRRHSSMLASYHGHDVMIDAGEDWLGHIRDVHPDAIVLTHAHPDHAWGLRDGAPYPVYATEAAWETIDAYPLEHRHTVRPREPIELEGIVFEAFPVEHSTVAPAVGYRLSAGRVTVFYVPDVVYINDRSNALKGVRLFVGDGASIKRALVRKRGDNLVGHASIQTQLTWCKKEGVPRAVFTHCGSPIVAGDERRVGPQIRRLGVERGVEVELAHDGMEIVLR